VRGKRVALGDALRQNSCPASSSRESRSFAHPLLLKDGGLGYLTFGQPSSTLLRPVPSRAVPAEALAAVRRL